MTQCWMESTPVLTALERAIALNDTLPRVPPNESFVISTQTPQGQLDLTLSVETKPGKVINGDLSE